MKVRQLPEYLTLTIETTPSFLDARLCVCNHPVHRHLNVYGVGCAVLTGRDDVDDADEKCPCELANFEAKFLVARGLSSFHGSIQVKRADSMARFIRRPLDDVKIPDHFRWFVRPDLRSSLFVLFPRWVDAIKFATRDWSGAQVREMSGDD